MAVTSWDSVSCSRASVGGWAAWRQDSLRDHKIRCFIPGGKASADLDRPSTTQAHFAIVESAVGLDLKLNVVLFQTVAIVKSLAIASSFSWSLSNFVMSRIRLGLEIRTAVSQNLRKFTIWCCVRM